MPAVKPRLFLCLILALAGYYPLSAQLSEKIAQYQKIRNADVLSLKTRLEAEPRQVAAELNALLNTFYSEDISKKKIQQDQLVDQYITENSRGSQKNNVNVRRLFIRDLLLKPIEGHLLAEAPNVFNAHHLLAQAYLKGAKEGEAGIFQAAYHYNAALRFRTLKFSPQIYYNDTRLALLEDNNPDKQKAAEYKQAENDLQQSQVKILKLNEEINVLSDNSRSIYNTASRANIETQIANLRNELTIRQTTLNDQKQRFQKAEEDYRKSEEIYNRQSADFLIETAMLLFKIENQIKDRSKILNRSAFEKSSFNTVNEIDSSENRDFTAFANLMETAVRLDNKNSEITFALAEEFRKSRNSLKAIEYYEKTLEIQELPDRRFTLPDNKITSSYTRLGGLYFETHKFINAAKNYEIAYQRETEPRQKNLLAFQLAKLHVQNTGNYSRSAELFKNFILAEESRPIDKFEEKLDSIRNLFQSYKFLAEISDKQKNYRDMSAQFDKALQTFEKLEKIIEEQNLKIRQTYQELQEAKKPLINDTSVDDLANYYSKNTAHEQAKADLSIAEGFRASLPLKNIYFGLANFYEQNNSIDMAIQYYQEAEKKGVVPDEARRNIYRLKRR